MLPGSAVTMTALPDNKAKAFLLPGMMAILFSSCGLLHVGRSGQEKSGCPVGKNIGAERILAGDPVAIKAAKKAEKNKQAKTTFYN